MKPWLIILILSLLPITIAAKVSSQETDSLMRTLEETLLQRETFVHQREEMITDLKTRLKNADNDEERYSLIGNLFDTYKPFNTDSAYYYSLQRERVARNLGDSIKVLDSRMNRASALIAVGMYHEVWDVMRNINPESLPDYMLPYYYYIMRTLKGNMADFSVFSPIRAKYNAETCAYRDSIIRVNEPGSLARAISMADHHNAYGQYLKAVEIMSNYMAEHELSDHDKAICAWTLADSYQHLGNISELKKQLIISSIGDIKAAVREYVSLRQLALLLYKEGDLERAYRFMNIAFDDANKSNARQRLVELSAYYPEISGIYVQKISQQKESLRSALWIIGILAGVLILALIYVGKQMKTISRSKKQLAEANDSLNNLNSKLSKSNESLNAANERLLLTNTRLNEANMKLNEMNNQLNEAVEELNKANAELKEAYLKIEENSRLKEAYIGKYMDQCMMQIDSIDTYRKSLLKLATSGKNEELKNRLKATDTVDDRLKGFYQNFDNTFLDLFPNFVDDFNALLLPEEAIQPKRKGTLNTELRIFALIRLGITDSDKIARFLRYSVTTIYNYRTKVRNKARGDRSLLEEAVRTLG